MFSKLFTAAAVVLAVSSQVASHAAIAPALGVSGAPVRADVQRPSTAKPCGTVNVASTLDTSTPVQAAADGTFTATVTDFNAGADGSRSVSGQVDATGAGTAFKQAVTVSKNGNAAPTSVGSDQITAALPAGTTCTGGTAGNLCLVSFKTTAGFGNCVVVAQGAGATSGAANATTGAAGTTAAGTSTNTTTGATTAAGTSTNTTTGTTAAGASTNTTTTTGATTGGAANAAGHKGNKAAKVAAAKAKANAAQGNAGTAQAGTAQAAQANVAKVGGSRAPRALRSILAELEARGEQIKRGSWLWA